MVGNSGSKEEVDVLIRGLRGEKKLMMRWMCSPGTPGRKDEVDVIR